MRHDDKIILKKKLRLNTVEIPQLINILGNFKNKNYQNFKNISN